MNPILRSSSGVTLLELLVTMVILSILATCILPLSQVTRKRAKEIELKQNLRTIRNALDEYYRLSEEEKIPREAFGSGYPETLEILVTGVEDPGTQAHSINESLHLGVLERAAATEALLLEKLGAYAK